MPANILKYNIYKLKKLNLILEIAFCSNIGTKISGTLTKTFKPRYRRRH